MKKGSVVIKESELTDDDRAVLQCWSGMSLPPTGHVRMTLTPKQYQSLQITLEMLGKKAPAD